MSSLRTQFAVNAGFNLAHFGLNVIIGIWLTPYLVRHLGATAFGLIPLAMTISEYIALITNAINGAVARYLTMAIQQARWQDANRVLGTAFFTLTGLILILIPVLLMTSVHIDRLVNIPSGFRGDAIILFAATFLGFLLSLWSSIFSSSLYANNRLDLCRILDIARIMVRLALIVGLFSIREPSLRAVGYANLGGSMIALLLSILFSIRVNPELRLSASGFERAKLIELLSFGGWTMLAQLGLILFSRLDLLYANLLVGMEPAGRLAALSQWSILIQSFGALLGGVIAPTILILHARGQTPLLIALSKLAVKCMALLIAIPAGMVCGFAAPLLRLWLGPTHQNDAGLLCLTMIPLVAVNGVAPLLAIQTAYNRLKIPALGMTAIGILNVPIVIAICKGTSFGLQGICLAGALIWLAKCFVCNAMYNAGFLKISQWTFVRPLLLGMILQGIIWCLGSLCVSAGMVQSWKGLMGWGAVVAMIGMVLSSFVFLSTKEREEIRRLLFSSRNSASPAKEEGLHVSA